MIESVRPYLKPEYGLGLLVVVGVAVLIYLSLESGKVDTERADLENQIVQTQEAQPGRLDERDSVAEQLAQVTAEVQALETTVQEPEADLNTRRDALAVIGELTDYITDREMTVASFNSEEVSIGEATGTAIRYSMKVSGSAPELTDLLLLSEETPNAVVRELSFERADDLDPLWEITLVFDVPFS